MKKPEIAARVFEVMDAVPLAPLTGGKLSVPLDDLAGLSLVPWFCDLSVQWALRLTIPGTTLKKSAVKKVSGTFVLVTDSGALLVGVPGDGIAPSTYALFPLAAAIASSAQPGMVVELATANLGVVKRDYDAKAETTSIFGNHRYRGAVDATGLWAISETTPALTLDALTTALTCGRLVTTNGPWKVKDKSEAYAVLMQWLLSPEANINPAAVQRFMTWGDLAFFTNDDGMIRRIHGLALGFFRHRLAGGPFRWPEPKPSMYPLPQLEEVASTVVRK